jgi:hypothetical protein
VFQPQQSVFGEDAYPSVPEKAAVYAFLLDGLDLGSAGRAGPTKLSKLA